ncbi:MAG TPA: mechanosensitive ion channel family protein [Candidatus Omnitrophota bacterium]|nr:mechanosensitive ion channel family protein [Candidatus Omnitrophota bacterium]HPS36659.1 mechanosensitive ion channel family protein [Candidatus Omnitrophota bacterium]
MEKEISTLQKFINTAVEFLTNYSFQVLGAIIVLVVGHFIGKWIHGIVLGVCEKKKLDITLSKFLANCAKMGVLAFAILIALGKFGITITPFIAMIGAGAFGASMALQGPLSNYGAGLSIILGRPFVVGDTVTVTGQSGIVQEVTLSSTILTDEDGVRITIPNKHIVGEIIHNSFQNQIVENMVGISYDDDPERAIEVIRKTIAGFKEVTQTPKPQVGLQEFGDSSINIGCRYWIPTTKYFQTLCAINLAIHKALAASKITMPYPQHDVHMIPEKGLGK